MSDQRIIDDAVAQHAMGEVIDDLSARVIANAWHGGQSSALYAFMSTGFIDGDLFYEITNLLNRPLAGDAKGELLALRAYVEAHDNRDPQPNWSDLTW